MKRERERKRFGVVKTRVVLVRGGKSNGFKSSGCRMLSFVVQRVFRTP